MKVALVILKRIFCFSVCVVLRRFVTDASVSLFVAILLFVFPSEPPYFLCFWRSSDTGNTCTRQFTYSEQVVNVATKHQLYGA